MSGWRVLVGDMREVLPTFEPGSVDAIVTDPPYELGFMGKRWDRAGVAFDPATWAACYRVLKPGGRLLAFGAPRTSHRIWCAIEDAGFVIEDTLMWMFGQGFPKHVSKLKPAYEPVCVARKGAVSELNIDACRIGTDHLTNNGGGRNDVPRIYGGGAGIPALEAGSNPRTGRWPANVILSHHEECEPRGTQKVRGHSIGSRGKGGQHGRYSPIGAQTGHDFTDADGMETVDVYDCHPDCPVRLLDEQSAPKMRKAGYTRDGVLSDTKDFNGMDRARVTAHRFGDDGGAARFFYCAKVNRGERNHGLEGQPQRAGGSNAKGFTDDVATGQDRNRPVANHHPTVKPVELMRYLVRLVTPNGGTVLDPFCGSGSTGVACTLEGRDFVGIELSPEYAAIAERRIAQTQPNLFSDGAA